MQVRRIIILLLAALVFGLPVLAAKYTKLELLAYSGTAQQMKEYLMKNRRFTQRELDDALFQAISNKDPSILRLLLAAGANPNAERDTSRPKKIEGSELGAGDRYWVPLEIACYNKYWQKVIMLLEAGANPQNEIYDRYMESPVSYCLVSYGNDNVVETMLKTGKVDIHYIDGDDETLYDCAKKNKQLSARVRNMLR